MVFESSHEIQKTSAALLTFNPDCDKLTISGSEKSVAVATSQMVMILDKHRDQTNPLVITRTDNDIQHDPRPHYLISSTSLDIQNAKNLSGGSIAQTTDVSPFLERNVINNTHKTNTNDCDTLLQSRYPIPDFYGLTESHCSVETDCAQVSSPHIYRDIHSEYEQRKDSQTLKERSSSSLSSSSSDDENAAEDDILTDLRYSKQVEQALKLGYPETHVKQALATLGPDCELNDLLSELIKIGAAETRSSPIQNFIQGNERAQQDQSWSEGGSEEYFYNLSSRGTNSASDSVTQKYIDVNDSSNLRHIIIDGSNVAMSHGKKIFSCKGIKIAVDWFRDRGHKNITVFVPMWRKETSRPDAPISDQAILSELEIEGIVVFTPSRRVKGRKVVCYDDRYILKTASETNGIVVSNDVYRDLVSESEDFRQVVDQRLLMYSFVNDRFMPPEDPLGRLGPTLDNFLRKTPAEPSPKPQDCPYGKKCTYGNKCRFYHPERGFAPLKLITETLKEQADLKLQERASKRQEIAEKGKRPKQKLARTKSLVPGESFPASMTSPTNENDSLSRKEKPKLHHSKSLVYPVKTPDYLNESRKKLEEAEMSAALEKMSVQQKEASVKKPLSPESSNSGILSKHSDASASQMQAPNQRTSLLPHQDNFTLAGLPLATSKSPRASPTHLTVPKSESQEVFLCGHLLLAKKLSDDESKENNFFSEHTSSPSSTRTSSPVVPSKATEQRQSLIETHFGEAQGNSIHHSGSGLQQQLLSPQLLQQSQAFDPRPDLPNLSVFEQNSLQYPSDLEHMASNRRQSADSAVALSPNTLPHSSDSSHYTGCTSLGYYSRADQLSSPFHSSIDFSPPSNIQLYKSNPLSKAESTHQPHEHLSLRRAFSSTGNVKTEEESLPSGRRASGFAPPQPRGDHLMLKAQQSVPAHRRSSAYQIVHPHGLTRQNSSSDPQLHSIRGAGDMGDVFLPAYGTNKVQDPQSFLRQQHLDEMRPFVQTPQQLQHSQQFDTQHFQRLQLQHQQQQFLQQQQQLHQQFQQPQDTLMSPQFMSKPPLVGWGQQNLVARPPLVQSPPQHSHMPVPGSGAFMPYPGDPALISSGPHMSSPPQSSPFPQQQVAFPAHYGPVPSPAMSSSNLRQSFPPQPNYPQHQTMIQNSQMYGLSEQVQRIQPSTLYQSAQPSSPASRILAEDAPIVPSDPRYTLYYNLSGVFPEQDVRKVMNMYPSELNPDRICTLITNYRETK